MQSNMTVTVTSTRSLKGTVELNIYILSSFTHILFWTSFILILFTNL